MMYRRSILFASLAVMLAIGACKPMHRQSDVSAALSSDGTMLTAVKGKDTGICMLQSSRHNDGEKARLLTVNGSISSDQLKKTLRFMAYGEQLAAIIIPGLAGGAVIAKKGYNIAKDALKTGMDVTEDVNPDKMLKNVAKLPVAIVIGGAIALGGNIGYHIIKGNVEGERAGNIASRASLAVLTNPVTLPMSPVFEQEQRDSRLRRVLSDKEQWQVTNRKMRKLVERIRDINPEYSGGCDHIKEELKNT